MSDMDARRAKTSDSLTISTKNGENRDTLTVEDLYVIGVDSDFNILYKKIKEGKWTNLDNPKDEIEKAQIGQKWKYKKGLIGTDFTFRTMSMIAKKGETIVFIPDISLFNWEKPSNASNASNASNTSNTSTEPNIVTDKFKEKFSNQQQKQKAYKNAGIFGRRKALKALQEGGTRKKRRRYRKSKKIKLRRE